MSTATAFKSGGNTFICETNRGVRGVLREFLAGSLQKNHKDQFDRGGWGRINKGIYFRTHHYDQKNQTVLQVALQENQFDNKYLLQHSAKIVGKIINDESGISVDSWGSGTGESLDIFGKGNSTGFIYAEVNISE